MEFFKKFFKSESQENKLNNSFKLKKLEYPSKVILAWAESLKGNQEITNWLIKNNFREIIHVNAAIKLNLESRDWLMLNGFPHLMAFINASEGDENAQKWLIKYKFDLLFHLARYIDGENDSNDWIKQNATPEFIYLAKIIKDIKDKIEENHNDIHSYRKDL